MRTIKRYYVWIVVCFILLLSVMIYIIGRNASSDTQTTQTDETERIVDHIDSAKSSEDLVTHDNPSFADNTKNENEQTQDKEDPNQGEWDSQSN